jgi:hypothetical protein
LKFEYNLFFFLHRAVEPFNSVSILLVWLVGLRVGFQLLDFVCLFFELSFEFVVLVLKVLVMTTLLLELCWEVVNLLPQHLILNPELVTFVCVLRLNNWLRLVRCLKFGLDLQIRLRDLLDLHILIGWLSLIHVFLFSHGLHVLRVCLILLGLSLLSVRGIFH